MGVELAAGKAARVFIHQPERIAAAWRRLRLSQHGRANNAINLLDDVVEPFTCELGRLLAGEAGNPWTKTRGILRLSAQRSTRTLHEEFAALSQCLDDALDALEASPRERRLVAAALSDALDSAVALSQQLSDTEAPAPGVPFGGVVVEIFERVEEVAVERPVDHDTLH